MLLVLLYIQQMLKASHMDLTLMQAAAPVVAAAPTSAAVQEAATKASPPADDDDDDDDEDVDLFGEMTEVSSTTLLTWKVLFLECLKAQLVWPEVLWSSQLEV